ncbi:hypothetical protein SAMN05421823_10253 [Catalinimonas alkaloidigena]|uniref:Lipoprotein n=1 Tax=Catalinimonas alkaloidigena TaxID=1075417 RepID=A0A1G8ZPV3_9BACT|nr:hypothetical protein [Catalinimonas alkaloidigena]SDK17146.1 hypothetical protein SAMN05421823_10253 [Catalinimonas alkaloidigena]
MKRSSFWLTGLFLLLSCVTCPYEPLDACTSEHPVEEIAWLQELKNSMTHCTCERSILQGTYQQKTVFFTALTDPACDGRDAPTLYDCNGTVVRTFTLADSQEYYDQVTIDKVLYRCQE